MKNKLNNNNNSESDNFFEELEKEEQKKYETNLETLLYQKDTCRLNNEKVRTEIKKLKTEILKDKSEVDLLKHRKICNLIELEAEAKRIENIKSKMYILKEALIDYTIDTERTVLSNEPQFKLFLEDDNRELTMNKLMKLIKIL